MTLKTFVMDKIKYYLIGSIAISIMVPSILFVVDFAGEMLIPALAALSLLFIVLIFILVPTVIMPCFNSFTDMEKSKLRKAIYDEAVRTEVPVSQIKIVDGSQRSSHSNAYVTGFGSARKVVLFDTLFKTHTSEEILAIINHELGHIAYYHVQ
jgi:STE24 endopeptidase